MTNIKGRVKNNFSGFLRAVVIGILILLQMLIILILPAMLRQYTTLFYFVLELLSFFVALGLTNANKNASFKVACPDEGRKIKIMASEEDYGDMWIDSRSTNIYWNHNSIVPTLRRINYQDDWSFGALHEIGHLFDPDNTWNFDGEF